MQAQGFANFVVNMGRAFEVNTNPYISWWASANKFFSLKFSEDFSTEVLMTRKFPNKKLPSANVRAPFGGPRAAASVDWVKAGRTTPVKDQVQVRRCS
jgi:hypothetical protein